MGDDCPAKLLLRDRGASRLSQRELTRRAGTSQSVVARIENGTTSPSWNTLVRLLDCMGFALKAQLGGVGQPRSHMLEDVPRILSLTPDQRLDELKNASRFFATAERSP